MSAHDPAVTLEQVRDAARRAQEICSDKTLEALIKDWQAVAALERFLEIAGEGVKRLPLELRARYPLGALEGNRRDARPFEARIRYDRLSGLMGYGSNRHTAFADNN